MRTDEERIRELHRRNAELRIKKRQRSTRIISAAGAMLSFVCVMVMVKVVSGLSADIPNANDPDSMRASIFADSGILGGVVIAVIAFTLGVILTVICYKLKTWQKEKDDEDAEWRK